MNIEEIRKYCGFYRKEYYIDFPCLYFCDMRHANKSIRHPDFYPTTNGYCDYYQCPILKFLKKIEVIT